MTARRTAWVAAICVALCSAVMIGAWLLDTIRAPANKARVDRLVEQVRTDPDAAEVLLAERDRQTAVSLSRKRMNRVLAWVVLVAGIVFVAAGKREAAQRATPLPGLDDLVEMRFPPPTPLGARNGKSPQAPAPNGDLSFVDDLVERFGPGREAAIPILQAIQTHYRYLPDAALERLCERTEITPGQIAGTSSFYAQFRRSPVGRHVVRVCHGTACHVAGADQVTGELRRHLGIQSGEDTDPVRRFTIDKVACVGCCSLAPVMLVEEETAGRLTPATARQALDAFAALEPPS